MARNKFDSAHDRSTSTITRMRCVRVNDLSRSKQGVWCTPHAEKQEDHTPAAIGLCARRLMC